MNAHASLAAAPVLDRVVKLGHALLEAGASAGQVEASVETLGRAHGLDLQCHTGPTSIHLVHAGHARLIRSAASGIDLSVQARLNRAVVDADAGVPVDLDAVLADPGPSGRSTLGEAAIWCLMGLTAASAMGGQDGTVLAAGLLGLWVGVLLVLSQRWSRLGALVPLVGALGASGGASFLSQIWSLDMVIAPIAAILVLLPGWSLTVGVGEVSTGHLASGSARLVGAFVTVLQLALGWVAGAELIHRGELELGPVVALAPVASVPDWLGMAGVAVCFALLFRAERCHWIWVTAGVVLGWGAAFLPLDPWAQSFVGACLIGLMGSALARATGLPPQLVTVPGVMVMVPGGTLLVAVLELVRHAPGGVASLVDAVGIAGVLVGGLLTARLLLPARGPLAARPPQGPGYPSLSAGHRYDLPAGHAAPGAAG